MKSIFRKLILSVIAVLLLISCNHSMGEAFPGHFLLSGEFNNPVTFCIYNPEYTQLAQFGKERLDSLNRLIKHISVSVRTDKDLIETVLSVDRDRLISFEDKQTDSEKKLPGKNDEKDQGRNEFISFLDERFFRINNLMDDLYTAFCKTPDSFPDLSGRSSASLNFSGFGKSASKVTIQFPSGYVSEHFPDALADLCNKTSTQNYFKSLLFSGSQKIVLLFDQNENLLRINYDGIVGTSENDMRKISLVWKCLRDGEHIKDSMTLKTPAIKGYNKNNIAYDRELDLTDPDNLKIKWDYQLDYKKEKEKEKVRYTGDLASEDKNCTAKLLYNVKGTDIPEHSIVLSGTMDKEKESEYKGTLEITNKTGKIITSSVMTGISFGESANSDALMNGQTDTRHEPISIQIDDNEEIPEEAIRILIQKIMTLPEEDIEFLRKDIPDELWKIITNH